MVLGWARAGEENTETTRFFRAFIIGSDSSFDVLAWAGGIGCLVSLAWARLRTGLSWGDGLRALGHGVEVVAPTLAVLVLAITIRTLTENLQTGPFLAALLHGVPAGVLPMAVFALSAAVAFTVGSSWATMGLLVPVALTLAHSAVLASGADPVIIVATAASVMDGAIFGDHCSPISDTTVMSSAATGCDHLAHVRTQMPYALVVMVAATLLGYGLSLELTQGPWLGYGAGIAALWVWLRLMGRHPTRPGGEKPGG